MIYDEFYPSETQDQYNRRDTPVKDQEDMRETSTENHSFTSKTQENQNTQPSHAVMAH